MSIYKNESIEKIREKIVSCSKCSLSKSRKNSVIGQGCLNAKIMFIGEAPGENEDKRGVPFCGEAGNILDELLESVGIDRKNIYITNILKCRPPGNRNPQKEEIESCSSYLNRQIEIINPSVICTLGNFATQYIFEKYRLEKKIEGISKIHGKVFKIKTLLKSFRIIPFYHPAVATYNPNMKEVLKKDFGILTKFK